MVKGCEIIKNGDSDFFCKKVAVTIFLLALFAHPLSVRAETILLNSGKEIRGEILEQTDDEIVVDQNGSSITYYLDQIKSIDGRAPEIPDAVEKEILPEDPGPLSVSEPFAGSPSEAEPESYPGPETMSAPDTVDRPEAVQVPEAIEVPDLFEDPGFLEDTEDEGAVFKDMMADLKSAAPVSKSVEAVSAKTEQAVDKITSLFADDDDEGEEPLDRERNEESVDEEPVDEEPVDQERVDEGPAPSPAGDKIQQIKDLAKGFPDKMPQGLRSFFTKVKNQYASRKDQIKLKKDVNIIDILKVMPWWGILLLIAVSVFQFAAYWIVYQKAGYPGWFMLIPLYNAYIWVKMCGKSGWWLLLCLIPYVNIIILIVLNIGLAKKFRKGAGFGLGLMFFPYIFFPILAFSKVAYRK